MKRASLINGLAIGIFISSGPVLADQVINDDLIVTFSECVGNDCVNGESFGFDTLRLKENNLRIHFSDTSNSASFPTNDWRITINDSSNGGDSYFSIDDASAGRSVFRVLAGAPSNSLYVDSAGDVGFGTNNPVTDLHVRSGNTPTLRLEQDGSSGFTAQTWDVAGNEAGFFIRDVTNGSTLPFRIRPDAPSSAIDIQGDGTVEFADFIKILNNTKPQLQLSNTSESEFLYFNTFSRFANIGSWGDLDIRIAPNAETHTVFHVGGNLTMVGGGTYDATTGTWIDASTRDLKENIHSLDDKTALATLKNLTPVTYNFKANKEEHRVGFIAEDVPDIVAMSNRKGLSSMDFVGVLTKVVQKQQELLEQQSRDLQYLNMAVERLTKERNLRTAAIAY